MVDFINLSHVNKIDSLSENKIFHAYACTILTFTLRLQNLVSYLNLEDT